MSGRKHKKKQESSSSSNDDQDVYKADYEAFMHSLGHKGTSHRDDKTQVQKDKTPPEKPKETKVKPVVKPAAKTKPQPQAGDIPLPLSTAHVSTGKRTGLLGVPDPSSTAK